MIFKVSFIASKLASIIKLKIAKIITKFFALNILNKCLYNSFSYCSSSKIFDLSAIICFGFSMTFFFPIIVLIFITKVSKLNSFFLIIPYITFFFLFFSFLRVFAFLNCRLDSKAAAFG